MKFRLITDNIDAGTGMRLAGIPYTLVNTAGECEQALRDAVKDTETGIILITGGLYEKCADVIDDIKKTVSVPLITEIPDNSGEFKSDAITRYVIDAIGIA